MKLGLQAVEFVRHYQLSLEARGDLVRGASREADASVGVYLSFMVDPTIKHSSSALFKQTRPF